jgi:hypothetical protein
MDRFARMLIAAERNLKRLHTFKLSNLLKVPPRMRLFLGVVLLCFTLFLYTLVTTEIKAGSVWGLGYGIAALVVMAGVALYGVRRRQKKAAAKYRLGSAYAWAQIHIYGGMLFLLLFFMHTGFGLPHGALNWWLWSISIWVCISGIAGVLLQKWLPKILASALSIEVLYERIPALITDLREKAELLVADSTLPVQNFYRRRLAASLKKPAPRFIYFVDITGGIQRRLKQFGFLSKVLTPEEREKLLELEQIYRSKLEIDAHYTVQKALRYWLVVHLPASLLMIALVLMHLYVVFYY